MRTIHFISLSLCASGLWACAEVTTVEPPSNGAPPNGSASSSPAPVNTTTPVMTGSAAPLLPAGASNPGSSETRPAARPPAPAPSSSPAANPAPLPPAPSNTPPPAPSGPPGEVLLFDDFEDGNDAGWIADAGDGDDLVGEWSVVAAEQGFVYKQSDDSFDDESWSVGGDVRWTDVAVQTRFRFTQVSNIEDATVMLALRFRSKDDYYFVEYRGDGSVKIRTVVDGSDSEASSEDLDRPATVGEWIDLRLVARGNQLTAFIDEAQVGQGTADANIASGGIALGVQENAAVEFDDVRVTRP
jgi:hypothetical protein